MPRTRWMLDNFSGGIHSEPARVPQNAGHLFASNTVGLRADANGHLRQRRALTPFSGSGEGYVTGVAADGDYLVYLRADGSLWLKETSNLEGGVRRLSPIPEGELQGQLSFVVFGDFAVVKATTGRAYWIDLREDSETQYRAFVLGLEPPNWHANARYLRDRDSGLTEGIPAVLEHLYIYVFRWTYIRAFGPTAEAIRDGLSSGKPELMQGMESNPGMPQVFFAGPSRLNPSPDIFDDEGNTYVAAQLNNWSSIEFTGLQHSTDPQVTGIALYQSEPVLAVPNESFRGLHELNVDRLEYRRIAYVPKGVTSAFTRTVPEHWPDRELMRYDNDILPEDAKQLVLFNDNLYTVADGQLRATEFRNGTPTIWAFPELNAVRRAGIVACAAYRNVLLFGGPSACYLLAGASILNGQVAELGGVGPVSPHAFGQLEDTVVFVGAAGFYIYLNGIVQKLSTPLDAYFEGKQIQEGTAAVLPSGERLFVVTDIDQENPSVWMQDGGGWFRMSWLRWYQVAPWHRDGYQFVAVADGRKQLQNLLWQVTDVEAEHDALIPFQWQSHKLDMQTEQRKRFVELVIDGHANTVQTTPSEIQEVAAFEVPLPVGSGQRGGVFGAGDQAWAIGRAIAPILVQVWVDDEHVLSKYVLLNRESLYPLRVPIQRTGYQLQFRIEGRGGLHLRALRVEAIV